MEFLVISRSFFTWYKPSVIGFDNSPKVPCSVSVLYICSFIPNTQNSILHGIHIKMLCSISAALYLTLRIHEIHMKMLLHGIHMKMLAHMYPLGILCTCMQGKCVTGKTFYVNVRKNQEQEARTCFEGLVTIKWSTQLYT